MIYDWTQNPKNLTNQSEIRQISLKGFDTVGKEKNQPQKTAILSISASNNLEKNPYMVLKRNIIR